ncbi:MAG: MAPEG family protein [Methylophilaceae bacterium]
MIPVTALFSAILFFLYYYLAKNVIQIRRNNKIAIGFAKNKELEQAVAAHSNFNQYVPLGLIMMACMELNKIHFSIIFLVGISFTFGRIIHAKSFLKKTMDLKQRVQGMKFTFWTMIVMAVLNIVSFLIRI